MIGGRPDHLRVKPAILSRGKTLSLSSSYQSVSCAVQLWPRHAPSSCPTSSHTVSHPMKTVSNSTPIRSRDARSAVQQSLLHTLPEEVLSRILHMVMAERWQFDFEATRADVLLVCKAFHRLGRGVLYEDVLLSSTVSFHTFFCVDMVDWEAVNGLTNVESSEKPSTRWKDLANGVLERREEDWSRVSIDV